MKSSPSCLPRGVRTAHALPYLFVPVAFALAAGCSGDDQTTVEPPAAVEDAPTYHQDIAPLLERRCVSCHRPEGIAPFALTDYEGARTWAPAAAAATQARVMPPWLMLDDGSCNDFASSRWLSPEEIQALVDWAEAGTPEGAPTERRPMPQSPALAETTPFQTPTYAPTPQGGELARFDDYRCFPLGEPLRQGAFLTGYEVLPGSPQLVHHLLVMPVDPDLVVSEDGATNRDVMAALDARSPEEPGWPCFGEAGDGVAIQGIPVTWAPGMGPVEFPPGVGAFLPEGTVLVAQVHYNLAAPGRSTTTDQTQVGLRLVQEVERPGFFMLPDALLESAFSGEPDRLPPGDPELSYTWERSFDDLFEAVGAESLDVYGLFPHMHELGRSQSTSLIGADGDERCLGEVPRWDFNWQLFYFYQTPVALRRGDSLRVTCNYDTTSRTEPTLPGWGTQNEMCLSGLLLVP